MCGNGRADDDFWNRTISQYRFFQSDSGAQPVNLQRRIICQNVKGHAHHCHYWSSFGDFLHGEHLLDLPGQGEAGCDELLILFSNVTVIQLADGGHVSNIESLKYPLKILLTRKK